MKFDLEAMVRQMVQEELKNHNCASTVTIQPVPQFQLYSVMQVSQILSISTSKTYQLIQNGNIPAVVNLGETRDKLRVRAVDLEAFINSNLIVRGSMARSI